MNGTQPPRDRRRPQQSQQPPAVQPSQAGKGGQGGQPTQPASTPAQQTESTLPPRRRRQHKRSRNGCYTCKQRHIRCDEQKPICTNCLVRGGACGYPVKTNSGQSASNENKHGHGSHGSHHGSLTGGASSSNSNANETTTVEARDQALSDLVASWSYDDLGNTANNAGDNLNMFEIELPFRPPYLPFTSPALSTYHSANPFDSLPVTMPLRSMELFHHMTHFRILTRSLVPKNPNNSCITMVLQDAGLFRGCILLAAMHYSWINGSLRDMEETYLYHKVEAIRLVNENISDPAWSELCATVIAAMALAESGIGDISAAEAHLKGLFTLINWRRPEEWQGRLHGLFQRLVLVAGTFISASKGLDGAKGTAKHSSRTNANTDQTLRFTSSMTSHFSEAQFDATKLSPFYFVTPSDYEASNADLEGMTITNALQRLSSLQEELKQTQPIQPTRTHRNTSSASPNRHSFTPNEQSSPIKDGITLDQELTQVLLLETESYLTSLLFRPDAPPVSMSLGREMYQPPVLLTSMNTSPHGQQEAEGQVGEHTTPTVARLQDFGGIGDIMDPLSMDFGPGLLSPGGFFDNSNGNNNTNTSNNAGGSMASTAPSPTISQATTSTNHSTHSAHAAYSAAASPLALRTPPPPTTALPSNTQPPSVHQPALPFPNIPPSAFAFPPYRGPFEGFSPSLLPSSSRAWSAGAYLYLHTFLADLWLPPRPPSYLPTDYPPPTQSRIDRNLCRWLLDTLCANIERTREAMQIGACSRELWIWQVLVGAYVVANTRHEDEQAQPIDPSLTDHADMDYFGRYRMSSAAMPSSLPIADTTAEAVQKPSEYYLGAWFRKQMRVWADAVDAPHWNDAKRNASTIAWPQTSWSGNGVLEDLWSRAMTGQGSP